MAYSTLHRLAMSNVEIIVLDGNHGPRCQAMGDNAGTHEDRPDDRCSAMEAMSA